MTSAAAVMVAIFAVFATLSMVEFKQLGVGLAAAVLLDAVIVRILIMPAAITVMGPRVWWPRGLDLTSSPADSQTTRSAAAAGYGR